MMSGQNVEPFVAIAVTFAAFLDEEIHESAAQNPPSHRV